MKSQQSGGNSDGNAYLFAARVRAERPYLPNLVPYGRAWRYALRHVQSRRAGRCRYGTSVECPSPIAESGPRTDRGTPHAAVVMRAVLSGASSGTQAGLESARVTPGHCGCRSCARHVSDRDRRGGRRRTVGRSSTPARVVGVVDWAIPRGLPDVCCDRPRRRLATAAWVRVRPAVGDPLRAGGVVGAVALIDRGQRCSAVALQIAPIDSPRGR